MAAARMRYGSDPDGLLCGFAFAPGRAGIPVDVAQGRAHLQHLADAKAAGFVWLHFNLSDAGAESCINSGLGVVSEFFDALREGSRSTRIADANGTLVAVVNDIAFEFSFDPAEMATLWLNVGPRLVVSARIHALRSIDRLREAVKNGAGFDSSVAFLNDLLHEQADVLSRIVRDATTQVDTIEDHLLAGRLQHKRRDLGKLRRVLVRLQRLLAPEPGALFRLLRLPPPWVAAADLEELRQATEESTLTLRDASALQERIRLLQEEIAAQIGEQTNRSLFTLTVVTVLALPINIVAGLLGMNVGGIPLAQEPRGFLIVVGVVALFTALAAWFAFRRRD